MLYFRILLIFVITTTSAQAFQRDIPDGFVEYTVQPGDTWSGLALNEQTQLFVMRMNRITMLYAHQRILLPARQNAFSYVPVPESYPVGANRGVVVFLREQLLGVYENDRLVFWTAVSSGENNRTPTGEFQVNYKLRMHYSTRYNNAAMPYSMQYQGHYFLHGGVLPGFPASHGCIRVLQQDAAQLFQQMTVGDRVIIIAGM